MYDVIIIFVKKDIEPDAAKCFLLANFRLKSRVKNKYLVASADAIIE